MRRTDLALERRLVETLYLDVDELGPLPFSPCFVQGELDWITPTALVQAWAPTVGGRVEIVAGAGHTPFLDDPTAFAEAVSRCRAR